MKNLFLSIIVLCISGSAIGQSFGNAINLDGIDDYAIVPHHESLNPSDASWSVVFWINAANQDQVAPVVMKRLDGAPYTQYSYGFGEDDPHDPEPGKRIRVNHIEDAGVTERSGYITEEVIDGNWHHIGVVADMVQDGITVYVDGSSKEFIPLYYFGDWPDVTTTADLIIAAGSSGAKVKGQMDELSIWNKALNPNQIEKCMNDTLSHQYYNTPDSGLVVYYRFEEWENLGINGGGDDDLRDFSIWQNHADAEGDPELIPSGIVLGQSDHFVSEFFMISPNPTRSKFQVSLGDPFGSCPRFPQGMPLAQVGGATLELVDLGGRKLLEIQVPAGSQDFEVNVTSLDCGVYFCRLTSNDRSVSKKLIIQR